MKLSVNEEGSLFSRASKALGWSFASTVFGKLTLTGLGILLARLLGPQQFGTAAVALVALLVLLNFNDLGVTLAIVRWPDDPAEIAPTVVTINIIGSLILYAITYFGAPMFSAAMGAPAATPVIRVLGISIITNGVVAVPAALLERYFRQDKKVIADQVHSWLSVGLAVALAADHFGAMSIAIGQVVGAIAGGAVIISFAHGGFRPGFNRAQSRKLVKFGLPLAGSGFVYFLIANVDNIITGHVLGAVVLGYYVLAWNLASLPLNMFALPVRTVAPAMFSRLQHDPVAMRKSFTAAMTLLGVITLPICLLICGAAAPLVAFVYGPRWLPAVHALVWLALLGALRILFELTYDYFVVLAWSRPVLTIQIIWLVVLIPALFAGAHFRGVEGVAMAGFAVALCVVLPCYLHELRRAGIYLRTLASRLWLPLLAAACVGLGSHALAQHVSSDFGACAAAGVLALVAIAGPGYRMRGAVGELRAATAAEARPEPRVPAGAAQTSPSFPALQEAAMQALLALAVPARAGSDMTVPLPKFRELQNLPQIRRPIMDASEMTLPLPRFSEFQDLPQFRQAVARQDADQRVGRHRQG